MRTFLLTFFIFISFYVFADNQRIEAGKSDSIQSQLDHVKSLLYSNYWKPIDKETYNFMVELINYMERSPIDTVIVDLKKEMSAREAFFTRDIHNIVEANQVEGYIDAHEINNSMINIEKNAKFQLPLESIMVPENEFVGMYSKLPLIQHNEMEKMISESITTLPDSIVLLIEESENHKNSKRSKYADSIVTAYLDSERKRYNDSLINSYRDSITFQYQTNYRQNYIDSLKKAYTDSVSRVNYQVLKTYNDSITKVVNDEFRSSFEKLISYVNRMPNYFTIYNLHNEPTTLSLQNEGLWFKWIYLKNMQNDSIGIRFENLDRNSVRVLVDESVNLSRITQRTSLEVGRIQASEAIGYKLQKVENRKPVLSPWKLGGKAYSGLSQTHINQFWSKGGTSSASVLSTLNYEANFSKGKVKWDNGLDAKLGLIYYIDDNPSAIRNWHKNTDNFEVNSRFGLSAFNKWYYSAEANFKTQFFIGFKNNREETRNSSIFSPAYLTFSAGFDYKPNKDFSAFLSPISIITTYVIDTLVNEKTYGLDEGTTRKSRIGMTGRLSYSKKITENINIKTRNSLFLNFGYKADEWQLLKLPDFDTETTIDFKVNHLITTQVNFHFIYDKELTSKWTDSNEVEQTGTRLQFKEFMTLGISYRF